MSAALPPAANQAIDPREPAAARALLGAGGVSALTRVVRGDVRLPSLRRVGLRLASIAVCAGTWQWASSHKLDLGVLDFGNVPAPLEVAEVGLAWFRAPLLGKTISHIGASLFRVFAGFAAAAVIGIGVGLAVGRSKIAEDTLLPPLEVLRPIPGVAWIPLAILMFPSSELSMIFITFIGALFPILLNTIHGVGAIDPRLFASARCLGARRRHLLREIVLPGALPSIVTGLSIGMGTSWFCLVTAEMIAGQFGIGYSTWEAYNLQNYPAIVVGMLLIGGFGLGSSALVRAVGGRLTPWYRIAQQRGGT